jgi:shikimate kinase
MAQRSSTYENTAHYTVDTDGKSLDEIAEEIVGLLS